VTGIQNTRRLSGLATAIACAMGAAVVARLAFTYTLFSRASLLDRAADQPWSVSAQDALDADDLVESTRGLAVLVGFASIIVLIVFAYRATTNLRNRGVELRWGPGWAITGPFIPIVNFWVPYQVMQRAWTGAAIGALGGQRRNDLWRAGFIGFWVSEAIGWYSTAVVRDESDASTFPTVDKVEAAGSLVRAVAFVAIIVAVRQIARRHDDGNI